MCLIYTLTNFIMEKQGDFLEIIKQQSIAEAEKKIQDKKAQDEKRRQEAIKCINDKSKWSYDVKNKNYTLVYGGVLYGMDLDIINALLKEQLNKEVISSEKVAIGNCDCDYICYCNKKLVVRFKE